MFIKAIKQYFKESRQKINYKYNPKHLHVGLIFLVYCVGCYYLPFSLFVLWAFITALFVPKFITWYLFDYKVKE